MPDQKKTKSGIPPISSQPLSINSASPIPPAIGRGEVVSASHTSSVCLTLTGTGNFIAPVSRSGHPQLETTIQAQEVQAIAQGIQTTAITMDTVTLHADTAASCSQIPTAQTKK